MGSYKKLRCAVGIVVNPAGKILIAKRPSHKPGGDLWEFPGGKIEENESAEDALIRELQEEIGIKPSEIEFYQTVHHDYPEYSVELELFWVRAFHGIPHGLEGQPIHWVTPQELKDYPFLEANIDVVQELTLI